jgi:hypothetical protein
LLSPRHRAGLFLVALLDGRMVIPRALTKARPVLGFLSYFSLDVGFISYI